MAEHGGGGGIRDERMLESALSRPLNLWAYGEPAALVAACAFGIAPNHPFVDGNNRTAWVLARLFLALNRAEVAFVPGDAIQAMLALPAGELSEEETADWFRQRVEKP